MEPVQISPDLQQHHKLQYNECIASALTDLFLKSQYSYSKPVNKNRNKQFCKVKKKLSPEDDSSSPVDFSGSGVFDPPITPIALPIAFKLNKVPFSKL